MAKKIPKEVRLIRDNPPTPVNWAFQKNISHSQINIYQTCNFRWKLQYKDKLHPFKQNIHSVFGSAMHETLQHYLDVMYNQSIVKADEIDLEELFQSHLTELYTTGYKKNNNTHFSEASELREFYNDGVAILEHFKKKRSKYFSKKGWHLVGCEIPIVYPTNKAYPNVLYMGYLDIVMYHQPTDEFHIIDLKTSTRGWRDFEKKDDKKTSQLVIYKNLFSKQYNVPIEDISIEFLILKRKLYDNCDFPQSRIQSFKPPSGKTKIKQSMTVINNFILEVFDKNSKIIDKKYEKNPSKWNCTFCPFKDDEKRCGAGKYFS